MDVHFPNSGWLCLSRHTLDALRDYKIARTLPTWDDTVASLPDIKRYREIRDM